MEYFNQHSNFFIMVKILVKGSTKGKLTNLIGLTFPSSWYSHFQLHLQQVAIKKKKNLCFDQKLLRFSWNIDIGKTQGESDNHSCKVDNIWNVMVSFKSAVAWFKCVFKSPPIQCIDIRRVASEWVDIQRVASEWVDIQWVAIRRQLTYPFH